MIKNKYQMHLWSLKKHSDFLENGVARHLHRERLKYILSKVAKIKKTVGNPLKILDLGCGDGVITKNIEKILDAKDSIYAVDNDPLRIARAKNCCSKTVFFLADAEKLNFEDNIFDVIIAHHVIEHIGDDTAALAEMHRVLKRDGLIILGVPNEGGLLGWTARFLQKPLYNKGEHINFYSIRSFRRLTEKSNFEEVDFAKFGILFPIYYINLIILSNIVTFNIGNWISQRLDFTADSLIFVLKKKKTCTA